MIISLRGTNGAGKSTIVREVMKLYAERVPQTTIGRKKPVGYYLGKLTQCGKLFNNWSITCKRRFGHDGGCSTETDPCCNLFVPGHYDIANGGIDTLRDITEAYDLVWNAADNGFHVLYEGKNLQDGVKRVRDLFGPGEIVIIAVEHPIDECIASVRERGHKIQEKTIRQIAQKVEKNMTEFSSLGYETYMMDRKSALEKVRSILAS